MRYLSRLKTGLLLSIASLRVLWSHPKLAIYPLVSGIASAMFMLALLGPLFLVGGMDMGSLELVALFVVYLGSTYITALFNAGLVYSVGQVFHGEEPSIRSGLRAASRKSGPLLVWAFVSAVVGVIIQSLESRGGIGAQIAAFVFSVGWAVATFFVIPVIVFERDVTAKSMFTRSASIFKDTWGETVGTKVGLGIIPAVIMFVGVALALGILFVVQTGATIVTAILIAVLAAVTAMLVGGVITGVAKTALYVYATENLKPEEFERFDFDSLFDSSDSNAASSPGKLGGHERGI